VFNNPYYTELDEAQGMDGCGFAGLDISQRYLFTSSAMLLCTYKPGFSIA
jgi:hypothetical protein